MIKIFNPHTFNIKVVNNRKRKDKPVGIIVSRKCYAVVNKINGSYKAIVNYERNHIRLKEGDELSNEQLILPFTENSLSLKGKTYIWAKEKDEYGHNICIIRNDIVANRYAPNSNAYTAVRENLLIAGHIIRLNGKLYFEYEDLIAYNYLSEHHIKDVEIDNDKPLFNK